MRLMRTIKYYDECTSPTGLKISIGSKWDYDRSLCNSQGLGLTVKSIYKDTAFTSSKMLISFEEDTAYEGYGIEYFNGDIFKPHMPTTVGISLVQY